MNTFIRIIDSPLTMLGIGVFFFIYTWATISHQGITWGAFMYATLTVLYLVLFVLYRKEAEKPKTKVQRRTRETIYGRRVR